ncbi:MAG: tripartite tricarboxylate transporter substrate binding protein [Pseudolabrys sp.]|nr:tripartite tricarboxylate transporter substrate binding protein [Pseudolabrys sp.]
MISTRTTFAIAAFAVAIGLGPQSAATAQDYPTKAITLVVGYAAGGGTDAVVRALADPLSKKLGVTILVQNVTGAGGGVAAVNVARAKPDGYTLIATTSSTFSLEPLMHPTAYKDSDFVHVSTIGQFQGAILAPSNAPFSNFAEMVAYLKKEKRPLKHATYFQLDRLLMGYVAKQAGFEVVFVPVDGGNGTVRAILGKSVDTGYSGGSWSPYVSSGDAKVIFATSHDRLALAPDVPAMKDLGYDIGTTNYITVSAPTGTPDAIVQKISDAIGAAIEDEKLQKLGKNRFMEVKHWNAKESRNIIDLELKAFKTMFDISK